MKSSSFFFIFLFIVQFGFSQNLNLSADFSISNPNGCSVPHTVFFTDQSIQADTWLWNFGDGSTSRSRNPIHTYTIAGTYNVSLRVEDTVVGGSNTKILPMAVVVEVPVADFNGTSLFGCGPLTANFNNTSSTAASYLWNFGDGNTSTLQSPSHTYNSPGLYTVSLKITTANSCTNTRTRSNYIQVVGPNVNFGLSGIPPTNPPYTFNYRDLTNFSSPPISWLWNFGDGNTSTLQNPSHTYSIADTFDVSLTVSDLDGCSRTFTRPNFAITQLINTTVTQTSAISCNGNSDGAVTVSPTLGAAPYSYSWSNGATTAINSGLSAGTYTVTVTDAVNNYATLSLQIFDPIPDDPTFNYSNPSFCINETNPTPTITGTTGGVFKSTAGLAIDSTSGEIDLASSTIGTYTVSYTTSGPCPESSSVSVTINPIPQVTLSGPSGACVSSIVTLTASTNATGYNFDFLDNSSASLGSGNISGTNSSIIISLPSSPGNYTYSVNVLDGTTSCSTTETITINVANPDDASFNFGATSYCNNESNPTPIISGTSGGSFSSSMGLSINSTRGMVDLSNSTSGIYLIKYTTNGSCPDSSQVNFTIKSSSDSTVTLSSCDSYTWPQNGVTYFNSGQFVDTIPSSLGCDSIVTLDLTINSVNSSITIDSNESCIGAFDGRLTAVAIGGTAPYTYNWSNSAPSSIILGITSATYTVSITDANGCSSSSSAAISVVDTIKPIVITQNVSVYLDAAGNATITPSIIDNGSSDACGAPTLTLRKSTFNCSEVGANTIQLIARDVNGNIDSASAVVTVLDTFKPTVITNNTTIYLDALGQALISTADVNSSTTDICGISSTSLSQTSFDCSNIGTNTVYLKATDANMNIDSASAIVTIVDTIRPSVITQNITVFLDATGNATIAPASIDNGSTDACGSPVLSLSKSTFSCADVGVNTIQLIATDVNNNIDSTSAVVTVVDTIKPTVISQNISIYLDVAGNATITATDINNGSSDACGTPSLSLRKSTFNCSEVGANSIQLIATDVNGNIDSAVATVTVIDTIRPTVLTQNFTIYLDASGVATITTAAIDNGSTDICGVPTLTLSKNSFTCSDVGANTVQLIAIDANNNIDSSSATVTVLDTIQPTIITQNISVYLDAAGIATISATDIDNGSTDICGAVTLSLDSTTFDCAEVGINTVILTGVDVYGNRSTNSAIVNVLDTIRPVLNNCPTSIIQTADAGSCSAVVSWTVPTAQDNCGIDSIVSSHNPNDVFAIGTTTVTYITYDESLNTDTCRFSITVNDNENPIISNVPSDTILTNDVGSCGAVFNWSAVTASDNCILDSLVSSHISGDLFPIGTTTITYTAYDNASNTTTESFTVTVEDIELPTIVCPSNISQCDSIISWTSPIGLDNCVGAITNRNDVFNLNSGDKFPIGITTLSYQVIDASNNQATCSFDIEVFEPPTANAGPDLATRDIEPKQIQANVGNAISISWTPFIGLSDATVERPIANPQVSTIYTLQVVSPDGCEASDEMEVVVNIVDELKVTTLFTPNGDGRNDTWKVNKPQLISGCQLVIFNRNGTEVFSTNNYNNDWDGTIRGEQLPEATYYYVIKCPDDRAYNGPITILREKR